MGYFMGGLFVALGASVIFWEIKDRQNKRIGVTELMTKIQKGWERRESEFEIRKKSWIDSPNLDCYHYATYIATGHLFTNKDELHLIYRDHADYEEEQTPIYSYVMFTTERGLVAHQGIYLGQGQCLSKLGQANPCTLPIDSLAKLYGTSKIIAGVPNRLANVNEAISRQRL